MKIESPDTEDRTPRDDVASARRVRVRARADAAVPSAPFRRVLGCAVAACAFAFAASADAQTWNYKSYKKTSTGQYDPNDFVTGTISVEPKGDGWGFNLNAGRTDVCYRGTLPATVTKTEELTVIEVTQPVPGCEVFRYTIRNDGSGGFKEYRVGERWVRQNAKYDNDLTPKR